MLRLNRDVLYLIFEELQYERKSFYSCLSVNKTWSEIIIPILWKNPWKYLRIGREELLLNVIILHLSDELRESLSLDTKYLIHSYQRPLFDYIRFFKHLNLIEIKKIIDNHANSRIQIITNEIFNLFINKHTQFTHLYIPYNFDYQIHFIPGAKHCFSKLEFLHCSTNIKDSVLDGLLEMCKSIRILELCIEQFNNNHGIVKLLETPKKLYDVRFQTRNLISVDESFHKILENSLIKRANNIQYFMTNRQPATKILHYFENLKKLELVDIPDYNIKWSCLENLSLPSLQILKAKRVPIKALTSLIKNTSGSLAEIKIDYTIHDDIDNKRIIQAIYQQCPNLKYLKILFKNNNIIELENLLIHCQYLDGLVIITDLTVEYVWSNLFKILSKSSPPTLFKFKISPRLFHFEKSLELFFDNWKGRHPMLLQIIWDTQYSMLDDKFIDLIEKYKTKGIVGKFDQDFLGRDFEDFEWIQKKYP